MQPYYYQDPQGNFGDDMNLWLWPQLLPGIFDGEDERLFVGIGTILSTHIPDDRTKIIFGSGVGYGTVPKLDPSYNVHFVRGPHTAAALGLSPDLALTDGAYALALLGPDSPRASRGRDVGFVPHCRTSDDPAWQRWSTRVGFKYISPRLEVEKVLREIGDCKLVVTESLHGAIVADAMRIPWVPVRFHGYINEFKWRDWCASVGVEYRPISLHALNRAEWELRKFVRVKTRVPVLCAAAQLRRRLTASYLSTDATHSRLLGDLAAKVESLRKLL